MPTRQKRLFILMILFTIGITPTFAHADVQMANQYLQIAMNELAAAKVYIQKAQAQEPKNERVVFHYDWVLSDINQIQGGIDEKFNKPRIQPRVVKPLKGDYLTVVGEGK